MTALAFALGLISGFVVSRVVPPVVTSRDGKTVARSAEALLQHEIRERMDAEAELVRLRAVADHLPLRVSEVLRTAADFTEVAERPGPHADALSQAEEYVATRRALFNAVAQQRSADPPSGRRHMGGSDE